MKKDDENLIKINETYPWLYKARYWEISLNDYIAQLNRHLHKEGTKMLPFNSSDMYNLSIMNDYKEYYTGCTNYFVSDTVAVLSCIFQPAYDTIICMHPFCTENENSAISMRIFSPCFATTLDILAKNAKNILDDKRHVGFKI